MYRMSSSFELFIQIRIGFEEEVYYVGDEGADYWDEVDVFGYETESGEENGEADSGAERPEESADEIVENYLRQSELTTPFIWLHLFGHG